MMINPQLIANAASNLVKNELKLDTKAPKNDFSSKESTLTGALKKNLGLDTAAQAKLVSVGDEDLNLKLKNLVNKVLDQLFAKNSPNDKLLRQSERLNFAPNFSNEIKFLVSEMKKSDIFSELLGKLEQILKPASEVKADNLAPLFKNSGVFFEAKLKDALSPDTLPKSFHSLLNAIKSLSSPKIAGEIIELATKDLSPKSSLDELKNILNAQKDENAQVLKNTNFKTLLALGAKLENFKNYISKNPNFAQSHIKELSASILKQLSRLESSFKQELARPENLALKETKFLKDLNQSFARLKDTLKAFSKGDFSAVKQPNSPINSVLNSNSTSSAPAQKANFAESAQNEFVSVSENGDETNLNDKNALKADEKGVLKENVKMDDKTANSQDKTGAKNESAKPMSPNLANESAKNETPNSKANLTAQTDENDLNLAPKTPASQENTKAENSAQKPNLAPANPAESEIADETALKNSAQNSDKNSPNSAKGENAKANLTNGADKANPANKADTNAPNLGATKANQPNTPNPTQASLNENKIAQDKAMPQNEPLKFAQNETPQVKNLIFTTDKAQMPELEHLNKELATLARRTNESLKQLDSGAQEAKTNLADIKNLEHKIERATKDLAQIAPKNGEQISNELKNDIKSTLLQVANAAKNDGNEAVANQANRLLAQIEFNQLMSLANDSINTYLPLFWEDLNESKVIFKRGKKDKYFAQIKLNFAKLGELDILIALKQDKYLDINIMAEHKAFRKTIYEHSHELRRALNKAGLLSSNFFVGDIIRSKLAPQEAYRNYDLQMGIDKKA